MSVHKFKDVADQSFVVLYIRLADLLEEIAIAGETIGDKLKLLKKLKFSAKACDNIG